MTAGTPPHAPLERVPDQGRLTADQLVRVRHVFDEMRVRVSEPEGVIRYTTLADASALCRGLEEHGLAISPVAAAELPPSSLDAALGRGAVLEGAHQAVVRVTGLPAPADPVELGAIVRRVITDAFMAGFEAGIPGDAVPGWARALAEEWVAQIGLRGKTG